MVFHPLAHAHDAIPEGGIYAILEEGCGGARGTVEQEQASSIFHMMQYSLHDQYFARKEVELTDRCLGQSSTVRTDQISPSHLPAITALYLTLILQETRPA